MKYELTLLVKEEKELENVKSLITSNKGKVIKEEKWGEKTLSYPIRKNHRALFFNFHIEIDKKNILEFKNKLNLNENVLRYLLLVRE